MSSTRHLDMAVAAVIRALAEEKSVGHAVANLAKDLVTAMSTMRIWREDNPNLGEAYDMIARRHPEAVKEIELYVAEEGGRYERLPRI